MRILYQSLVLDMNRLRRLLTCFDRAAASSTTRYLTIHATLTEWDTSDQHIEDHWLAQIEPVDRVLSRVPSELLAYTEGLVGFSFSTDGIALPHTTSTILRSLPLTCVDLEINTNYEINAPPLPAPGANQAHLCDDVRVLLPRMRHARIHLGTICHAIVGTSEKGHFRPIAFPLMQRLLVDCAFLGQRISRLCHQHQHQHGTDEAATTSWHSVIAGLQQVSTLPDTNASIVVMAVVPNEALDRQFYTTVFRCHVVDGQLDTWAFPVSDVMPPKDTNWAPVYIRTKSENYVVSGPRFLHHVSQGSSFWEVGSGLGNSGAASNEATIWTEKQWRETYPRNWSTLWRNERLTGMRLIGAERRQDAELKRLVELTPKGWKRVGYDGFDVERIEEV